MVGEFVGATADILVIETYDLPDDAHVRDIYHSCAGPLEARIYRKHRSSVMSRPAFQYSANELKMIV